MQYLKLIIAFTGFMFFTGCAAIDCKPEKERTAYVLSGTNTAVIGVSLDKADIPQVQFKEIIVTPGQKILYAGPDEFSIFFKNRKTPNRKIENPSNKGVVIIQIPKDILEKSEYSEEFRKTGQIKFNYGIRVNGKELDPMIIIKRDN